MGWMEVDSQPPPGQPTRPHDDPREAVARARANVLAGRGSGADRAETDRYKRERPTLGPLPAPLERELVHLHTIRIRSDQAPDVAHVAVENQLDRLQEIWAAKPAHHPRSVAMARILGAPTRGGQRRWRRHRRKR